LRSLATVRAGTVAGVTDAEGRYQLTVQPLEKLSVQAELKGVEGQSIALKGMAGAAITLADLYVCSPQHQRAVSGREGKESPFVVQGRITDEAGKPLQGVEVWASCGMGSLRVTGETKTGADGRYRLPFGPGGHVGGSRTSLGVGTQVATITPRMKGWYEIHLGRRGNLLMAEYDKLDADDTKGYSGVVTPNKPYELNFTMTRGATVKGRLLNEFGSAVARQTIYLTGDVLPPSCGVLASFETGEDGRFQFDSVPVWLADPSLKLKWRFSMRVHGVRHELESDSFEVAVADPKAEPESQELTIDSTSDNKVVRLYLRRKVIPPQK
jgi:hypothetical protein